MAEEVHIFYKFKNRKTGEITEAIIPIKNVENHAPKLKHFFNIHEYRIVEKRLSRLEKYNEWRKQNQALPK